MNYYINYSNKAINVITGAVTAVSTARMIAYSTVDLIFQLY